MTGASFAQDRPPSAVSQAMLMVPLACLPGASALVFFFGWGVLLNLVWLGLLAVAIEALMLKLRAKALAHLRDCSAVVTGLLLALALPPTAPWWLGLVGIVVAIVIAKQLYGGTGRNLFNPAMAGYAILLSAFPLQMTRWLLPEGATDALPSFSDSLLIFLGREPEAGIDAFTGATALDSFRHDRSGQLVSEFMANSPVMGDWSGLGWEWVNAGFLMGGLYLVYRKIVTWHIPAAMLAALALWSILFYDGGSSASGSSPLFHLFGGATMLGAFFVATDPVTAPATLRAKLVYGALIGSAVYAMRNWGGYPDGVAFAVLLANLVAPLLDAYASPGAGRRFSPRKSWTVSIATLLGVALLLALVDVAAWLRRPDMQRDALAVALPGVMPADLHDNDLAAASFTLDPGTGVFLSPELLGLTQARTGYRATLNGEVSGVVLPLIAPGGYGGAIELLIGIDASGAITGLRVLQHAETRGFGDSVDPNVSRWILGFENRSLANTDAVLWAVKKDGGDFDQFVGATVTPRAVVAAVHDALRFFETNKERLLDVNR